MAKAKNKSKLNFSLFDKKVQETQFESAKEKLIGTELIFLVSSSIESSLIIQASKIFTSKAK